MKVNALAVKCSLFRSIVMSIKLMVSTPQYKIDVKSYITQMLSDGSV